MSREVVMPIMTAVDFIGGFVAIYIVVMLTRMYGFGHWRTDPLQLIHRWILLGVAAMFEVHAEQVIVNTEQHGLSLDNLVLHVALLSVMILSAVRTQMHNRDLHHIHRTDHENGGLFTGPFSGEP
jgi:hypothetical protein